MTLYNNHNNKQYSSISLKVLRKYTCWDDVIRSRFLGFSCSIYKQNLHFLFFIHFDLKLTQQESLLYLYNSTIKCNTYARTYIVCKKNSCTLGLKDSVLPQIHSYLFDCRPNPRIIFEENTIKYHRYMHPLRILKINMAVFEIPCGLCMCLGALDLQSILLNYKHTAINTIYIFSICSYTCSVCLFLCVSFGVVIGSPSSVKTVSVILNRISYCHECETSTSIAHKPTQVMYECFL